MNRDALKDAFLADAGWAGAQRALLAGDASFRSYDRVRLAGRHAVLMDAPPGQDDDTAPFIAVARWLTARGIGAPAILAEDATNGLVLLEDLGDDLYARIIAEGRADETALYAAAVDVLPVLHAQSADWLPPYDRAVYLREAGLLIDWFYPAVAGTPLPLAARDAWTALWDGLIVLAAPGGPVPVLRDYHAENLLWLPERDGHRRVGQLDFQDALAGSAAYDLVSLLEDARRDVPRDLAEAMIARYLAARPNIDPTAFRRAYAILGAQRNAKIVGIFVRLCRRDGKPRYLSLLPRVWGHLEHDLAHPALAPLKAWFDRWIPPALRHAAIDPAGCGA